MILTIGMIMKNEEKNLPLCLEGIKPILEAIPSELIIVDTGSTDNSVEIAKKYTDDVRYFEWCNDFSAARNVSLEGAKGEWYMFLDADEIFTDTTGIINFFKSGEYKKYNSATYVVRNYNDYEKTGYADFIAPRLTKILPHTKFEKSIHEGLNTYAFPLKNLDNAICDHFGYVLTDETAKNKCRRNLPLILNEHEKNPDDSMIYMQLVEAYKGIDEDEALRYCDEGIELNNRVPHYSAHMIYLHKAELLAKKKKYEEAISAIEDRENFKKRPDVDSVVGMDIDFYYTKAFIFVNMEKTAEAISAFREYSAFYKDFCLKGKYHTVDTMLGGIKYANPDSLANAMISAVKCCIKENKMNSALDFLSSVPIKEKLSDSPYMALYIKTLIIVCRGLDNYSPIKRIYSSLSDDIKYIFCGYIGSYMSEHGADFAKEVLKLHISPDIDKALSIYINCEEKDLSENELVNSLKEIKALMERNEEVRALAKFAAENIKKKIDNKLRAPATDELSELAKIVKGNIRNLISSGNIAEAKLYLSQLKALCPMDNEIAVLENMIENSLH